MRPLEGVTVVALEHVIAGPFCTRQLADLGARIIKIERPEVGDPARIYDERVRGLSSHFVWTNRSKESITLDLKQQPAREIVRKLLESADVLVQNLAPGAAARMGFSYDQLKDRFPRLIVCDISGYGADGPYRDKKAYDLLIQSESGLLSVTGTPETPSKAGCSIVDIASGMYAYTNILAALIQRGRTGQGCRIDISMLESMAEWMSFPLYYAYDGADAPPRAGASHATIYPYGPFPAGDGKVVMLGLQNEREWAMFCDKVLGQPELKSNPRFSSSPLRSKARKELYAIIVEAFAKLTAEQIVQRLDEAQIGNARMNDMREVWEHAQLRARERWVDGRYAGRQDQGDAAARRAQELRAAHGSGARARPAHRRDPRRAGLRARRYYETARDGRDMSTRCARSYLYVPGNRPDRFDKACAAGADAVIVDLEDAVPAAEKASARAAVASWLSPARAVLVRVNAADTEWFEADLAACDAAGIIGVVLPKAETIGDAVIALCRQRNVALLPLIETAAGMAQAAAVAATPCVQRLMFGTIDFQLELGIDGDGDELLAFRSELVLASRLAGIQAPVDGPCTSWDDPDLLAAEARRARKLGFGGKLCIHPKQIASVNAAFSPSETDVAWARKVVEAAKRSGGAAVAVDGKMIDRPVILKAERVLRDAGAADQA